METKILKAVFGGGTSTVTNKRTRTDYGQVLEIIGIDLPDTFECIFSNSNTSAGVGKKMIGSAQRVLIPDEYLATGQTIYAWVLVHDTEDDGRHMYSIKIPVDDMPDTSPEEPTPAEESVISQAITALNSAVTTTTQKAQEATESADRAEHAADGIEVYVERAESAQTAAETARDKAEEAKTSAQESATSTTESLNEVRYLADIINRAYVKIDDWTQIAYGASQQAIASEQASTESARQASQSAETASTKAQEASGFASEASQKASEAAQSASTAVQAKMDAESAKTASETAQGLAESARDGAVTAQEAAESARDEAQDIADGITGKVEQIESNTDRIESLEDDRYKPYAVDTASGSIASFPDGADDIPLKSCIVQIEPVQSGSGDPSPDNIRPITGWTGCEVKHSGADTSNPTTYPIAFPSEAGTIYGGYIDPINGDIVADMAIVDMGTLTWSKYGSSTIYYTSVTGKAVGNTNIISDTFFLDAVAIANMANGSMRGYSTNSNVYFRQDECADLSAWTTWLTNHHPQLCYELATPITYTLTPQEITSLLGTNNLWADTGDVSVEYRADVTLYINKKITEAVSALS